MKAFFVGLLVLVLFSLLSVAALFLLPVLFLLGFFLRWLFSLVLLLFGIWLIGKLTLKAMEILEKKSERKRRKREVSEEAKQSLL